VEINDSKPKTYFKILASHHLPHRSQQDRAADRGRGDPILERTGGTFQQRQLLQHQPAIGLAAEHQRQQQSPGLAQHSQPKSSRSFHQQQQRRWRRRRWWQRRPHQRLCRFCDHGGGGAVFDHERRQQHRQLLDAIAVHVVESSSVSARQTTEPRLQPVRQPWKSAELR
jgi:hypothetical protein